MHQSRGAASSRKISSTTNAKSSRDPRVAHRHSSIVKGNKSADSQQQCCCGLQCQTTALSDDHVASGQCPAVKLALPCLCALPQCCQLSEHQTLLRTFTYHNVALGQEHTTDIQQIKHTTNADSILAVAHEILTRRQPIKCLEAVLLALLFTNQSPMTAKAAIHSTTVNSSNSVPLVRLPLRFHSHRQCRPTKQYWHIVLLVYNTQTHRYGTLSLSRESKLDYRACRYESVFELMCSFLEAYHACGHIVTKMTLGRAVPHCDRMMSTSDGHSTAADSPKQQQQQSYTHADWHACEFHLSLDEFQFCSDTRRDSLTKSEYCNRLDYAIEQHTASQIKR